MIRNDPNFDARLGDAMRHLAGFRSCPILARRVLLGRSSFITPPVPQMGKKGPHSTKLNRSRSNIFCKGLVFDKDVLVAIEPGFSGPNITGRNLPCRFRVNGRRAPVLLQPTDDVSSSSASAPESMLSAIYEADSAMPAPPDCRSPEGKRRPRIHRCPPRPRLAATSLK